MKKTYELCPSCEEEVQLEAIFKVQICPACGELILPCSLCPDCTYDCPLDKELENARKARHYEQE